MLLTPARSIGSPVDVYAMNFWGFLEYFYGARGGLWLRYKGAEMFDWKIARRASLHFLVYATMTFGLTGGLTGLAYAQLTDILTAPKTLVDRAIEARSFDDIKRDNEIVIKVNQAMADVGTIKASTEIYEQRLLITGLFDDKDTYDKFQKAVRAIKGVKKLYWQVTYLSKVEQDEKRKAGALMDWADTLTMETKAEGRLIGTAGVSDVNFRIAGDAFGTLYLLGRARSKDEADKAVARTKDGTGVKKVVSYVDIRP
jgi:hyperosmotically inducible protein